MKKISRLFAAVLAAGMLCVAGVSALAAEEMAPISAPQTVRYAGVTGTVEEIIQHFNADGTVDTGRYRVLLTTAEEQPVSFVITGETVFLTEDAVKVGDQFTAYYDMTRPVIMIYPPQYVAVAAAVNLTDDLGFKVAVFDETLLSDDGLLALALSDSSMVLNPAEGLYTGKLEGAHIAMLYTPFQAEGRDAGRVVKAIVLSRAVEKPELSQEIIEGILSGVPEAEMIVEGAPIESAPAYVTEDGVIMVPVRAIAEALGYEVGWDGAHRAVTVGDAISFADKTDSYSVSGVPCSLGTAAKIVNNTMYVPLNFFREIAVTNNAYFFEGQIVVDNGEIMH